MATLHDKTLFISGASRGIGKAITLCAAVAGANIVIAAKSVKPVAKLEGTIYSAAEEIEAAGGRALPVATDIRDEAQVETAVELAVETFSDIDILINNASAISLTNTRQTSMKRFELMYAVNALWPRTVIATAALAEQGITDLTRYALKPGQPLFPDLFFE